MDVGVDINTGVLKYAIQYDGWRNIKEIETHPDSGNQLNGVAIENWEDIKAEVIKFQQAFPFCKAAGWDIAITDDGPVVIEVNDFWDRTGQFFIRRGWRSEIRDCYIAWRQLWAERDSSCNGQSTSSVEEQRIDNQEILGCEGKEYRLLRQGNALCVEHLRRIVAQE